MFNFISGTFLLFVFLVCFDDAVCANDENDSDHGGERSRYRPFFEAKINK